MSNEVFKIIFIKYISNFLAIKLYKYKKSFIRFTIFIYSKRISLASF